jgi:hypothetical protein
MRKSSRIHGPIALRDFRRAALAVLDRDRRAFVGHVLADLFAYLLDRIHPVAGETMPRAAAAARWLARAHDVTGRSGLSYGYFPCRESRGWRAAYPETTGYTIPTLFEFAARAGQDEFRARAIELARWEIGCQMASGAIPGGEYRPQSPGIAASFNTGMVLHGFSAAYRHTGGAEFAEAARRAADFLTGDINAEGYFRSHGAFVAQSVIKTFSCLCAWPLYLVSEDLHDERYATAARRIADAALRQERQDGWFANNCLSARLHAPFLHTIGYTLQGLLELGIASGREEYVAPVVRAIERLLPRCEAGFLHSRWYADWEPAAFTSCLTGSAQIAVVCYRLAEHTGDARYQRAADALVNYLKALQLMASPDANIVGALGGSFPLVGAYIRLGYPQWATKYFLDALLHQDAFQRHRADALAISTTPAALPA